jgi:hypothetical protein
MSIEFENKRPLDTGRKVEESPVTYALMTYVFGCMPRPGDTVPLEQVAEDLEETPDVILLAMDELRLDGLLDYTCDDGIIGIVHKDEEFLEMYTVYKSIRR